MDIEKNDVDITKLFLWKGEVLLVDGLKNTVGTVYMRLVGDKDLNKARVFSLRRSAELRKELHTEGSDANVAFIQGATLTSGEALIAGIKLLNMSDYANEAKKMVLVKFPKELSSEASLEEQEEYQKKIDEFPTEFANLVAKEMDKLLKQEDKELEKLSDEELLAKYKLLMVNYICQEEMSEAFGDMCVFLGSYKDEDYKERLFDTFDEYENIASVIQEQLKSGYQQLELGMSELKKLPEVTPSPPLGESQEKIGE